MVIKYRVPEFLQSKFSGLSQDEIDGLITGIFCSNNIGLVQNMCLDILTTVTNLEKKGVAVHTEEYIPNEADTYKEPVYSEVEDFQEYEEEEVIGEDGGNSGLMDFLNFVVK